MILSHNRWFAEHVPVPWQPNGWNSLPFSGWRFGNVLSRLGVFPCVKLCYHGFASCEFILVY